MEYKINEKLATNLVRYRTRSHTNAALIPPQIIDLMRAIDLAGDADTLSELKKLFPKLADTYEAVTGEKPCAKE